MGTEHRLNWPLLKEIFLRPGVLTVSVLYAMLQLAFNFIAWTLSPQNQAKYQLVQLVTWRVWIAVTPLLTGLLIVLIVRAAVQAIGKREVNIQALSVELKAALAESTALLDNRERRKSIREQLGRFLTEGDELTWAPGFVPSPDQNKALGDLVSRIGLYLSAELDDSYSARFAVDRFPALKEFIKELRD